MKADFLLIFLACILEILAWIDIGMELSCLGFSYWKTGFRTQDFNVTVKQGGVENSKFAIGDGLHHGK